MSITRFREIATSQGLSVAIQKAFKFGPIILTSKLGRLFFKVNSETYWNYRLFLNWSNAGGVEQTQDFAESLFVNVDMNALDFESVLDFGCALGDSSSVFRSFNDTIAIHLWDVSSVGLNKALKRNQLYRVQKWDRKTKVDLVYCSNVIEHIPDTASFMSEVCAASKKWICIQCPYNERHADGEQISPTRPLGEHVWTIDDAFIERYLKLSIFSDTKIIIGEAPKGWPGGKQLYFLGKINQ